MYECLDRCTSIAFIFREEAEEKNRVRSEWDTARRKKICQRLALSHVCCFFIVYFLLGSANAEPTAVRAGQNLKQSPATVLSEVSIPRNSGLVVFDVRSGERIFTANERTPLKPASVLKVLTALAALEQLGPYERMKTEVRGEDLAGSTVKTLILKGYGDPSLVQEDLWLIARKIFLRGVRKVGAILVDDSVFTAPAPRRGERAYQAGGSALSLNYNSFFLEVCPVVGQSRAVVTHEPHEFPVKLQGHIAITSKKSSTYRVDELNPASRELPLVYRLKGSLRRQAGCQTVARSVPDPTLYAGYVFRGFLQKEGVEIVGSVEKGVASDDSAIIHTHYSEPLIDTIRLLNLYSNNMIAEQLVTLLGSSGEEGREQYDREKGLDLLATFLSRRGVPREEYVLKDGSGLSHENRLSADALAVVLREALTREELHIEFASSLPVDSESGTLLKKTYPGILRAKTGTLDGVTSLAGSVQNIRGRDIGFVLIQNEVRSRDAAVKLEKRIVQILRDSNF